MSVHIAITKTSLPEFEKGKNVIQALELRPKLGRGQGLNTVSVENTPKVRAPHVPCVSWVLDTGSNFCGANARFVLIGGIWLAYLT